MNKRQSQIYIPPTVFVGELFTWKGYSWKVQAFSPNGGDIELRDETGTQKAIAQSAVLVVEVRGKTAGTLKREHAASKRSAMVKRNGFRPKPIGYVGRPIKSITDKQTQ